MMENFSAGHNIVLMRMGAIGEAVSLLPVLRNLTRVLPEENLTLISEQVVYKVVLRDFPRINHIAGDYVYSNRNFLRLLSPYYWFKTAQVIHKARQKTYDDFICFHTAEQWTNRLKPAFFRWVLPYERSVGFSQSQSENSSWDIHVPARSEHWEHLFRKQLRLINELGVPLHYTEPWIGVEEERSQLLHQRLRYQLKIDLEGPTLMVCPGAADPWRCWPPEKYKKVLQRVIQNFSLNIALIGTSVEREICEQIHQGLNKRRVFNLAGYTSLEELPELINFADLFLSNDTGPFHIAVACQIPTVGLFGPGILHAWASYDLPYVRPVYKQVPEDPFLESYRDNVKVLHELTVDQVWENLLHLHGQYLDDVG